MLKKHKEKGQILVDSLTCGLDAQVDHFLRWVRYAVSHETNVGAAHSIKEVRWRVAALDIHTN